MDSSFFIQPGRYYCAVDLAVERDYLPSILNFSNNNSVDSSRAAISSGWAYKTPTPEIVVMNALIDSVGPTTAVSALSAFTIPDFLDTASSASVRSSVSGDGGAVNVDSPSRSSSASVSVGGVAPIMMSAKITIASVLLLSTPSIPE